MEELLFLVHRIPYPPNKGDKIRSFHLLKHISRSFKVHIGAFVDDPEDWKYEQSLMDMVTGEVKLIPLSSGWAKLRSTFGLFSGEPLTIPYYRNAELQNWVSQLLANRPVHRALVFSSSMSQYVSAYPELLRIIDFVDIDSDKWRQYSERKSWPMNWIYRREARTLLDFERRMAVDFDASAFVSRTEAEMFQQLAPECAGRVTYYNNGVDLEYFSPAHDLDNPYHSGERVLVFTGAMDYWANVDAVVWFASMVFPHLREQFTDLRFFVVGSRPTDEVLALACADIIVTKSVPDVRPYIAHSTISVAPLRIARGIQNKVLEAMAMAKPVVASPQAIEGIDAEIGLEVILANGEAEFISRIADQLSNPDNTLGMSARRRVVQDYSWDKSLQHVDRLLGQVHASAFPTDQPK